MGFIFRAAALGALGVGAYWLGVRKRGGLAGAGGQAPSPSSQTSRDLEARLAALEPGDGETHGVDEFESALDKLLQEARGRGDDAVDVTAEQLHRLVGGYPGPGHRMAACCSVMRGRLKKGDLVLKEPDRGDEAALSIRYHLAPTS